jgi:hypothetical protein
LKQGARQSALCFFNAFEETRGMANLFQTLEAVAARGAAGLTSEARESVAAALGSLQCPDGGFAGLGGRADPYYTLFAWLSLRALGAAYDRDRLCAYMAAHRCDANRIDARCASFLLAAEGWQKRVTWLNRVVALMRCDTRGRYAAFLTLLAMGDVPRWVARLGLRCRHRLFATPSLERWPTPRLAAGLVLAAWAGEDDDGILSELRARHCASGGFASMPNIAPDLLATAVTRFAMGGVLNRRPETGDCLKQDLGFAEACWLEDGLFGSSPSAVRGDSEHTFYGLMTLGTCR